MCKILVIPTIQPETNDLALKLSKEMGRLMSDGNRDGLGYTAMGGDGEIFGERWWFNYKAFNERNELTDFDRGMIEESKGFYHKSEEYNKFGSVSDINIRAITLHARAATSGKAFVNTHPFVSGHTSLIHNGIISNVTKNDLKISTCDSEKILSEYLKHQVMFNPKKIRQVAAALDGYYACAVFSKDRNGTPILDVFKCDYASLSAAYVQELNSIVITTALADLHKACAAVGGLTVTSSYEVNPGVLIRYNALTGQVIGAVYFKPRGWNITKTSKKHGGYPRSKASHSGYTSPPYTGVATKGSDDVVDVKSFVKSDPSKVLRVVNGGDTDGWQYNSDTNVWRKAD